MGKGSVKGFGSESANAACAGSFVPLLTLGIPGSGTTAILLGALIALNVSPGPRLMEDNPDIFGLKYIYVYWKFNIVNISLPSFNSLHCKNFNCSRSYLIPFILFFTLMGSI